MTAEYNECYVAYLDILGFTELVKKADEKRKGNQDASPIEEIVSSLHQVFERATETKNNTPLENVSIGMFSDSWSISVRQDEKDALFNILNVVAYIQGELPQYGLCARGGLSKGGHYEDELVVLGQGFNSAVKLEKKLALYPRVVIDAEVVRDINNYSINNSPSRDPKPFVLSDSDGVQFIDYLEMYNPNIQGPQFLEHHKKVILICAEESKKKANVLLKYMWLATYHNYKCDQFSNASSGMDYSELMIGPSELPAFPSINTNSSKLDV